MTSEIHYPSLKDQYLDGEHYDLVERIFSYSLVNYIANTVKNCYSYAKQSNYYVKSGLETAESYTQPILHKLEEYSHQPTINSYLHKFDQFGCKQLDKIESSGRQIRGKYENIKKFPSHTYSVSKEVITRNADAIPHLQYCIGVLSTAAHRVQDISSNTQAVARNRIEKGAELTKASLDYIYDSLHHMVQQLMTIVVQLKKLDPIEAKATVEELTAMIKNSKDELYQKYSKDTAARLKEDISRILQRAGELLSQQIAAGYHSVHSSDNATIRKSVETIEKTVLNIVESFSGHHQNQTIQ